MIVVFKNSEFAQMPHKGTPIRYGQKQPVRNRQQGAEEILQRRIWAICKQENEVSVQGNL
jgi:hypothetical protein